MDPREPESLRRYSLFGGILDPQLRLIAARMRQVRYRPGEPLIREGERGDAIFLLVSGHAEVLKQRADGAVRHLARLDPGATVGEMEIIDLQPRSCSVVAVGEVEALSIDRADLLALKRESIDTFAILALNLARDLSRRLRQMNRAMTEAEAG